MFLCWSFQDIPSIVRNFNSHCFLKQFNLSIGSCWQQNFSRFSSYTSFVHSSSFDLNLLVSNTNIWLLPSYRKVVTNLPLSECAKGLFPSGFADKGIQFRIEPTYDTNVGCELVSLSKFGYNLYPLINKFCCLDLRTSAARGWIHIGNGTVYCTWSLEHNWKRFLWIQEHLPSICENHSRGMEVCYFVANSIKYSYLPNIRHEAFCLQHCTEYEMTGTIFPIFLSPCT